MSIFPKCPPCPTANDNRRQKIKIWPFACEVRAALIAFGGKLWYNKSMDKAFSRTALLLGEQGVQKLNASRVAVFGLGGVGGYCLEALARAGVGEFELVDGDDVDITNINRQILALRSTVGRRKCDVAAERVLAINPAAKVTARYMFYTEENAGEFDFSSFDYIVDAVDTVAAKVSLALHAQRAGVGIISCMGAGNKLDPAAFEVADIYKTSVCPLARAMRAQLKKAGVTSLKVVYSRELPVRAFEGEECTFSGRPVPASCSFVPSVAGLIMAGEVVKDIIKNPPSCT